MLYIAKCAAALRERSSPFRDVQENSGGRKNKRKFMALALAAAMTVSMTSAVFAADEIKSADDLTGRRSVFSLELPVTPSLQISKMQQ